MARTRSRIGKDKFRIFSLSGDAKVRIRVIIGVNKRGRENVDVGAFVKVAGVVVEVAGVIAEVVVGEQRVDGSTVDSGGGCIGI